MDAVIEKSRRGKSTAGIAGREKMKLPGKSLISSSRRGPPSPGPAITWEFLIHLNPLTDSLRDALFRGPSALSAGSFRGAVWAERGRREPEFLAAEERTDLAVNLLVHEKLRVIAVDERERPLPGIIEAVRRGGGRAIIPARTCCQFSRTACEIVDSGEVGPRYSMAVCSIDSSGGAKVVFAR